MASGTMVERMMGAAFLSTSTFEEVEHDQTATGQAAAVVTMVAVAQAIGASSSGLVGAAGAAVAALVGWLVWAGITYVVGDKLFGAEATWGEVMRALGFAQAPGLLSILGIVPLFWLVGWIIPFWVAVAGFIGLRQALDIDNVKTLATVVIGWLGYAVLAVLF